MKLKAHHLRRFFANEPEFAQRFHHRRHQVSVVNQELQMTEMLTQHLTKPVSAITLTIIKEVAIWRIMLAFRSAVWSQLISVKAIECNTTTIQHLVQGDIPITFHEVTKHLLRPNLKPGNNNFHKGNPYHILEYLFGWQEFITPGNNPKPKKRTHWSDKSYRTIYKTLYLAIKTHCGNKEAIAWKELLFQVILATNPLLPQPDSTTFIQKKHNGGQYIWTA